MQAAAAVSLSIPNVSHTSTISPIRSVSKPTSNLLQAIPDLNSLKQIHAHIVKSQSQPSIQTSNALITLYSLFNQMDSANLAFQAIIHTTNTPTFSYNMMIRGFSTYGPHLKSLELYSQMLHSDIPPDKFTYPFVLKACTTISAIHVAREAHGLVIQSGLTLDVYILTALVDLYSKLRAVYDAHRVFDDMPLKNVVSWNAMIAGYGYNGLDEEAVRAFGAMLESSLKPNSSMVVVVLPVVTRLGALEEGKFIHEWILRKGVEMNELVRNSLIAMYGKCGELGHAQRLFDEMPERTDASWNAIISVYVQNGLITEALELFYYMQISGVRPTAKLYCTLALGM